MRRGGNPSPSFLFASRRPAETVSPVTRALMDAMDATGLPARQLARASGVTNVAISHWRHGKSSPRLIEFETVAQAMGYRLVLEPIEPEEPA